TRHPEFEIVVWIKPGPSVGGARQTFGAHPTIHVSECDGSVRTADGSVRPAAAGLLLPAVRGELLPAVRGELLPAVRGELLPAVRGAQAPTVQGALLPAVRGELIPAVQTGRLTMVETNGVWGDGSQPPQPILIGLNRA
ncbi:MAG TPA: hypothetical protein VN814_09385, partial [Caulobacteraceae bacterium]|nr:hypothetical protein [Caulobacteraceae bacterium]